MVSSVAERATSVEFGADDLKIGAASYRANKRIVDAASGYDNLADAQAALSETWGILEKQADNGGGFTPAVELGFGSDNAAQIAQSLMGLRPTVGSTRKAFATLGK